MEIMIKYFAMGAVALMCITGPVEAKERIKVHEIHNFVNSMNSAINNVDLYKGRNNLENLISNQVLIEDNVNGYAHNRYLVNNPYNNYYYGYRYPYYNSYSNVGYTSNNKWEFVNKISHKKKTVAGYKGMFELGEISMTPLGESAVIDVDFKEQSLAYHGGYAPYYYNYADLVTHSKCKMHLDKVGDVVRMTRMYCNTSTKLPI